MVNSLKDTSQKPKKKRKALKITLISICAVIVLCIAGFFIYVSIYYHADEKALEAMRSDSMVTVTESDGRIVFEPQKAEYGLIFYPGGKVEYKAYAPLMRRLAKNNVLCVITKMPFNLAVFDKNAADGIQDKYPGIKRWYIGGHSLGGVMAASYVFEHTGSYEGLILLAAYSTDDLSDSGLNVISVYGSNDGVLNMDKYRSNIGNLPSTVKELVIEGGCHAYFGSYGKQRGDGEPDLSPEEQIRQTVDFIILNIEDNNKMSVFSYCSQEKMLSAS